MCSGGSGLRVEDGEFIRGRSVLLYDILLTTSASSGTTASNGLSGLTHRHHQHSFENRTNNMSNTVLDALESPAYLRASVVLCSMATVPYILFIGFTLFSRPLLRPKNIFKGNFAASAVIHLVRGLKLLIKVLPELFTRVLPDNDFFFKKRRSLVNEIK